MGYFKSFTILFSDSTGLERLLDQVSPVTNSVDLIDRVIGPTSISIAATTCFGIPSVMLNNDGWANIYYYCTIRVLTTTYLLLVQQYFAVKHDTPSYV